MLVRVLPRYTCTVADGGSSAFIINRLHHHTLKIVSHENETDRARSKNGWNARAIFFVRQSVPTGWIALRDAASASTVIETPPGNEESRHERRGGREWQIKSLPDRTDASSTSPAEGASTHTEARHAKYQPLAIAIQFA